MNRPSSILGSICIAVALTNMVSATMVVVDFEELPLGASGFFNGSDLSGGFQSQDVDFNNLFTNFGGGCCWSGWAYSDTTDTTTPGPANQYSAFSGSGAGSSSQYGVAFEGLNGGGVQPLVSLPEDFEPVSMKITNTTFAALSMQNGDSFAKKFGGPSGNDPDWFQLHVTGWDASDTPVGEVTIYLADYRFSDNSEDYILDDWVDLDLTSLQDMNVTTLAIEFSSSDVGMFGINTPQYVAVDDLVFEQTCAVSHASDFNFDCNVDQLDLTIWKEGYGQFPGSSALPADGDATGDGHVGGTDFLVWQSGFGLSPLGSQVSSVAIPEPTTLSLLGLVAGVWIITRRNGHL